MTPRLVLVLALLGCSSSVEQRTLMLEAEADTGATTDGGRETETGGPEAAPPGDAHEGGPSLGDYCLNDRMPGTVCLLRPDASLSEFGCMTVPGRCEPLGD